MGVKLIYHSDDLGATAGITSRMLKAWEDGLLDGFSIFANSDCFEDIGRFLGSRTKQTARIAAHLNLWEGKPILPSSDVPLLVDQDGFFNIEFMGILKQYLLSSGNTKKAILNEVEREWRAQIEKIISVIKPRPLSAIDGHIHMHMLPFLFRIAAKLAREYRIPEIRIVNEPFYLSHVPRECSSSHFLINTIKHFILQVCVPFDLKIAEKVGLTHPDAMLGVLYSGMMSIPNILAGVRAAENNGAKKIEILVHIGRAKDSELSRWKGDRKKAGFVLSPSRDQEYAALLSLKKEIA
ncbi:MAG: ChbG/HpnK family deacetylase [Candidatus Omnitrophica bacterium]|nr:ChbG/HpnK family deacetylase [Candidatus Omnitrophota bacterium]